MPAPTVLAALTAGVLDAATALGLDRAALVAEVGLDPDLLADPDGRVPVEHDLRLWQALSRQPIGLRLGDLLGLGGLGVLGYAMQHGATVGEALAWMERFRAVIHPDVVPHLVRRDGPGGARAVFVKQPVTAFTVLREPMYAQAAATIAVMRTVAGRDVRALAVSFPMARAADADQVAAHLGCPVTWATPALELAFDAALLDRPLPRSDPRLFGYLARRTEELWAALPAEASVADRARREIGALLAQGEPRLGDVARRLALSERTLHRRLRDEGTSFATLLDEARRDRALLLLEDPRLSASEVAFLLGYAEPATFFRAFRRWTGATPQSWRKRAA